MEDNIDIYDCDEIMPEPGDIWEFNGDTGTVRCFFYVSKSGELRASFPQGARVSLPSSESLPDGVIMKYPVHGEEGWKLIYSHNQGKMEKAMNHEGG